MTRLVATLLLTAPGLKISVSWDRQRRRVPEASTSVRGGRSSGRAAVETASDSLRDLRVAEMARLLEDQSNPMYRQRWK
ncbi:MAG: hypothetical protein QOE26_3303 [Verrucomicrobiota bacterium]|jgi:hypothetical protein